MCCVHPPDLCPILAQEGRTQNVWCWRRIQGSRDGLDEPGHIGSRPSLCEPGILGLGRKSGHLNTVRTHTTARRHVAIWIGTRNGSHVTPQQRGFARKIPRQTCYQSHAARHRPTPRSAGTKRDARSLSPARAPPRSAELPNARRAPLARPHGHPSVCLRLRPLLAHPPASRCPHTASRPRTTTRRPPGMRTWAAPPRRPRRRAVCSALRAFLRTAARETWGTSAWRRPPSTTPPYAPCPAPTKCLSAPLPVPPVAYERTRPVHGVRPTSGPPPTHAPARLSGMDAPTPICHAPGRRPCIRPPCKRASRRPTASGAARRGSAGSTDVATPPATPPPPRRKSGASERGPCPSTLPSGRAGPDRRVPRKGHRSSARAEVSGPGRDSVLTCADLLRRIHRSDPTNYTVCSERRMGGARAAPSSAAGAAPGWRASGAQAALKMRRGVTRAAKASRLSHRSRVVAGATTLQSASQS